MQSARIIYPVCKACQTQKLCRNQVYPCLTLDLMYKKRHLMTKKFARQSQWPSIKKKSFRVFTMASESLQSDHWHRRYSVMMNQSMVWNMTLSGHRNCLQKLGMRMAFPQHSGPTITNSVWTQL